jgi:MFS transporter, DHA1 family, putative efflux transporter
MPLTDKGPPAGLVTGWLTVFIIGTDLFVVAPLLPLIAADYRVSTALAGLCVTVFSLTYVVAAPLIGHVADKVGRRRVLTGCLAAFAAANLATGSAGSFVWLLTARFFAGAAAAGVSPSVYALVGAAAPPERRATWLSLTVSGLLLALTFGAPIAALASVAFGWPSAFVGLGAASLVLVWVNHVVWPGEDPGAPGSTPPAPLRASDIAARLAPMLAWSTALYGMYTYLGAGLAASGFSTTAIVQVVIVYGAGAICGSLLGGRLADRFGARTTGGLSLAGLFVAFLVLRLAVPTGILAAPAFTVTSAIAQLFFPAQQAGLVQDFPANRAAVLAWNNSALFLGISLGSLIGGQAVAVGGFEANLAVSAAVALLGWAIHSRVVALPARPRGKSAGRIL